MDFEGFCQAEQFSDYLTQPPESMNFFKDWCKIEAIFCRIKIQYSVYCKSLLHDKDKENAMHAP